MGGPQRPPPAQLFFDCSGTMIAKTLKTNFSKCWGKKYLILIFYPRYGPLKEVDPEVFFSKYHISVYQKVVI